MFEKWLQKAIPLQKRSLNWRKGAQTPLDEKVQNCVATLKDKRPPVQPHPSPEWRPRHDVNPDFNTPKRESPAATKRALFEHHQAAGSMAEFNLLYPDHNGKSRSRNF